MGPLLIKPAGMMLFYTGADTGHPLPSWTRPCCKTIWWAN